MQSEGDLVGMRCAPGNDTLQLHSIVGDGADFHQVGFDVLRGSHRIYHATRWHAMGRHGESRLRELASPRLWPGSGHVGYPELGWHRPRSEIDPPWSRIYRFPAKTAHGTGDSAARSRRAPVLSTRRGPGGPPHDATMIQ